MKKVALSFVFGLSTFVTYILALLVSCNSTSEKESGTKITTVQNNTDTGKVAEYIRLRDNSVNYFKGVTISSNPDKFLKQEADSLKRLENLLKDVLKGCQFANISKQGKINLETLIEGMGFGLLDGLTEEKDSMTIFCTSMRLFNLYFEKKINHLDNISSKELEDIFQSTFASDVSVNNFTSLKMPDAKGFQVYGMLGLMTQTTGPYLPNSVFILVFDGRYVYMVDAGLKDDQIKIIPECQIAWDSIESKAEKNLKIYNASNLKDTVAFNNYIKLQDSAWDNYRKSYQENFKKTGQFKAVKRRMDEIVKGIEN